MGNRENKVEAYLHKEVKRIGGITYKWVSPGCVGVPDRIVMCNGQIWFIEVKTIDGESSPKQKRKIAEIIKHGGNAACVYGVSGVDKLINEMKTVSEND